MIRAFALASDVWLPLAIALYLAALGLYSWRRRSVPAARWLAASSLAGIVWLVALALQAAAVTVSAKYIWRAGQVLCVLPAMTAVTCFVLEYAFPGRWLTRRNLVLLWLPPAAVAVAILLSAGRVMWSGPVAGPDGELTQQLTGFGELVVAYGIGLVLVNLAAFAWLFVRSPQHRWPVTLMVVAQVAARAVYLLDAADRWQLGVNPILAGIALSWSTYAVALFGFRIFDPLPAARRAVFDQMQTGVVVFDPAGRILSLNPAAQSIFEVRAAAVRGRTWPELVAAQPALPLLRAASDGPGAAVELPDLQLGGGAALREYAPTLAPLSDARGLLLGHVLMLRDVTAQKRAQAQIVEQQQSLAALRERERLARELHDSIGQVLSYAGLQVEAAEQQIERDQAPAALRQLRRLSCVLGEAHADLRQTILDLRAVPSSSGPFLEAVQRYLDGFMVNYDIRTELTVKDMAGGDSLPSETRSALFRILQEALSNARRHGRARNIRVALGQEAGLIRMIVEDDGCGFQAGPTGGGHLGLAIVRDRAAELGGRATVTSTPGAGTRVVVEIPHEEG